MPRSYMWLSPPLAPIGLERAMYLGPPGPCLAPHRGQRSTPGTVLSHPGHSGSGESPISWGVLLPWSAYLLTWDFVCSIALLIMCFYLPFRLAFQSELALSWPGDAWLLAIDVIYLLDIGVAMSSAYYDYLGNLEARRSFILRRYAKGWMALDIVTCFPFDWIYLLWASTQDDEPQRFRDTVLALRALRLGRALRLMAHQRVFTYLSHVFTRLKIRAAYTTILKRTVVTIIFAHCAYREPRTQRPARPTVPAWRAASDECL